MSLKKSNLILKKKKAVRWRRWKRIFILCLAMALFDIGLSEYLRHAGSEKFLSQDTTPEQIIRQELLFFPVARSQDDSFPWVSYVDSWAFARTYGGDRKHEGCDVMAGTNQRGIYPVVSMTDGVLEQIGWLRLGGWRIGIRASSGTYYYYAHLESYAEDLREGMQITAGTLLGFMGDSGYGSTGTVGQFAVHLHVGIYKQNADQKDIAIDPYPYLKNLEKKKNFLSADYKTPES